MVLVPRQMLWKLRHEKKERIVIVSNYTQVRAATVSTGCCRSPSFPPLFPPLPRFRLCPLPPADD
jgi:hypothetical protein